MRFNQFYLSSVLALIVGLTACTQKDQEAQIDSDVLRIANGGAVEYLDPTLMNTADGYRIAMGLFESLMIEDPKTAMPIAGAAERWKKSKQNKTYTFYLRKDAKWSDGKPVTAHDFVYAWQRGLTPEVGSRYAYSLYYIKNAKKFYEGKIKDFKEVGVKALDDYTLQVDLEGPTPFFLSLVTHSSYFPLPRWTIEQHGNQWTRPGNMVSNGAYILQAWNVGEKVTVAKNPHYWDADKVRIPLIEYWMIENDATALKLFKSGTIDYQAEDPPTDAIPQLRNEPYFIESPYLGTYYYSFNTKRPPLDNPKVRRALALAIDRESIVKNVSHHGIPTYNFSPPHFPGYQAPVMAEAKLSPEERIREAQRLLAEVKADMPKGATFPPIDVMYNTRENHRKIAQAIQQMWKNNLGIDVTLTNQEWKVFIKTRLSKNYDIAREGWIGDYPDPNTFLDLMTSYSQNNNTAWGNTKYDALIQAAALEGDAQKRFAILHDAEKILLDEMPVLPIFTYTKVSLVKPHVKGWYPNLPNHHHPKFLWLDKKNTVQK